MIKHTIYQQKSVNNFHSKLLTEAHAIKFDSDGNGSSNEKNSARPYNRMPSFNGNNDSTMWPKPKRLRTCLATRSSSANIQKRDTLLRVSAVAFKLKKKIHFFLQTFNYKSNHRVHVYYQIMWTPNNFAKNTVEMSDKMAYKNGIEFKLIMEQINKTKKSTMRWNGNRWRKKPGKWKRPKYRESCVEMCMGERDFPSRQLSNSNVLAYWLGCPWIHV